MPNIKEQCIYYLAFLRSLYLLHQNFHWITSGPNFYSKHLLFERLYKSAQEDADAAAEKLVGLVGVECADLAEQAKIMQKILNNYATTDKTIENAMKAEKEFLAFSSDFYGNLQKENLMTLGLDDQIMSICNSREESVYLLKQHGEAMNSKMSQLANKFKIKLGQVPNQSAPHLVDPNAGPKNGDEAAARTELEQLQAIGETVKAELATALALHNISNTDLKFTALRFVNSNGVKSLEWALAVSPGIAKAFNAGVQKQRQASGANFNVGRYVSQLFKQQLPAVQILPAQSISIG